MIGWQILIYMKGREDRRWEMNLRGADPWGCPWTYKGKGYGSKTAMHLIDCSFDLISEDIVFEAHSLKIYWMTHTCTVSKNTYCIQGIVQVLRIWPKQSREEIPLYGLCLWVTLARPHLSLGEETDSCVWGHPCKEMGPSTEDLGELCFESGYLTQNPTCLV